MKKDVYFPYILDGRHLYIGLNPTVKSLSANGELQIHTISAEGYLNYRRLLAFRGGNQANMVAHAHAHQARRRTDRGMGGGLAVRERNIAYAGWSMRWAGVGWQVLTPYEQSKLYRRLARLQTA